MGYIKIAKQYIRKQTHLNTFGDRNGFSHGKRVNYGTFKTALIFHF